MFERLTLTFPIVAKSTPPPFDNHKRWGTRAPYDAFYLR